MKQPDDRSRRCFLKASSMLGLAVACSPGTSAAALGSKPPAVMIFPLNILCSRSVATGSCSAIRTLPLIRGSMIFR